MVGSQGSQRERSRVPTDSTITTVSGAVVEVLSNCCWFDSKGRDLTHPGQGLANYINTINAFVLNITSYSKIA